MGAIVSHTGGEVGVCQCVRGYFSYCGIALGWLILESAVRGSKRQGSGTSVSLEAPESVCGSQLLGLKSIALGVKTKFQKQSRINLKI